MGSLETRPRGNLSLITLATGEDETLAPYGLSERAAGVGQNVFVLSAASGPGADRALKPVGSKLESYSHYLSGVAPRSERVAFSGAPREPHGEYRGLWIRLGSAADAENGKLARFVIAPGGAMIG